MSLPETHKVVRLYPPGRDVHVEILPTPKLVDFLPIRVICCGYTKAL